MRSTATARRPRAVLCPAEPREALPRAPVSPAVLDPAGMAVSAATPSKPSDVLELEEGGAVVLVLVLVPLLLTPDGSGADCHSS